MYRMSGDDDNLLGRQSSPEQDVETSNTSVGANSGEPDPAKFTESQLRGHTVSQSWGKETPSIAQLQQITHSLDKELQTWFNSPEATDSCAEQAHISPCCSVTPIIPS